MTVSFLTSHREGLAFVAINWRVGKVRHGNQFESPIEDAEHFVVLEVEHVNVLRQLRVRCCVSESQIAIAHIEGKQMRRDAVAVARA